MEQWLVASRGSGGGGWRGDGQSGTGPRSADSWHSSRGTHSSKASSFSSSSLSLYLSSSYSSFSSPRQRAVLKPLANPDAAVFGRWQFSPFSSEGKILLRKGSNLKQSFGLKQKLRSYKITSHRQFSNWLCVVWSYMQCRQRQNRGWEIFSAAVYCLVFSVWWHKKKHLFAILLPK